MRCAAALALLLAGCASHRLRTEVTLLTPASRAGQSISAEACNLGPADGSIDRTAIGVEHWTIEDERVVWRPWPVEVEVPSGRIGAGSCVPLRVTLPPDHPYSLARLKVRVHRGDGGVSTATAQLPIYGERLPDGRPVERAAEPQDPIVLERLDPMLQLDLRCGGFAGFRWIDKKLHLALLPGADRTCLNREAAALGGVAAGFDQLPVVPGKYPYRQVLRWFFVVTNVAAAWFDWMSASNGEIHLGVCEAGDLPKVEAWLSLLPVPRDVVVVERSCLTTTAEDPSSLESARKRPGRP